MSTNSLKSNICKTAIACAKTYKKTFAEYDYLVCSSAFVANPYYIISADTGNYKHLTGVDTYLSAEDFFKKCFDGTLTENDFFYSKKYSNPKQAKNFAKLKSLVLPQISSMFKMKLMVYESFSQGKIVCSFASATPLFTMGFSKTSFVKPKTLLNGYYLPSSAKPVDLVLRRKRGSQLFTEIIVGSQAELSKYSSAIASIIDPYLFK